jgi:hypothetical protein
LYGKNYSKIERARLLFYDGDPIESTTTTTMDIRQTLIKKRHKNY